MPPIEEMYPDGFDVSVHVGGVTQFFEGRSRPTHFAGVATVVLKLYENYDHGLTSMASDKKEETFFKTRDFIVANIF